ncbi:hypothetical protein GCM10009764_44090 [Nocardia ninae]|uniref:Uncharacterized protein n=1 Tax=Nocardia ninae NBRC 108245 TaxID=1210091 RepID=A0A511M9N7_9NOCA|nr:hypothetical protein NN4_14360 [Nocardia ninae NBRC 108245]
MQHAGDEDQHTGEDGHVVEHRAGPDGAGTSHNTHSFRNAWYFYPPNVAPDQAKPEQVGGWVIGER